MSAAHPIDARRLLHRVIYQALREDKSARRFGNPPSSIRSVAHQSRRAGNQRAAGLDHHPILMKLVRPSELIEAVERTHRRLDRRTPRSGVKAKAAPQETG
jgi:hypothetical protein